MCSRSSNSSFRILPAGLGADVLVSSVVLWVLVFVDGRRDSVRWLWLPIVANLMIGVSSGLPLFLYMREVRLEKMQGRPFQPAP